VCKVSVIVITRNEEHNIRECLESIKWADEIVVVDSKSEDKTVEIAKKFTEKVFIKDWEGYGQARNFALLQCRNDWVLWLDADERVTPELKREIEKALQSAGNEIAGFSMPRRACFLGTWIKHCGWYPARVVRLFRKEKAKFSEDKVHEKIIIDGKILRLKSDILHYTDPNLEHYLKKLNTYTSLSAEEYIAQQKDFSIFKLVFNPLWIFVRMYIIKLGFLDGVAGFVLCVLSAYHVFIKYAKLWELSRQLKIKS